MKLPRIKKRRRVTFEQSLEECRQGSANVGALNPLQEFVGIYVFAAWYAIVGVPETPEDN